MESRKQGMNIFRELRGSNSQPRIVNHQEKGATEDTYRLAKRAFAIEELVLKKLLKDVL